MNLSSLFVERLGALIAQSVRDDAASHGLLPIQLQVLHYVASANRYSDLPIAIAEYFGLTRGTISQTLLVLERKGLLTKNPDPAHGKRLHLALTPAGRAILAGSWAERLDAATQGQPGLEESLRVLLGQLQRMNGQRAFGICHQCDHFSPEAGGGRCGLTGEALESEQTQRLCREWTPGFHPPLGTS